MLKCAYPGQEPHNEFFLTSILGKGKHMKKIIALTLALGMTVGIASACGKKAEPAIEEETGEEVEEVTEEETEAETEPEVTEEETEDPKANEVVVDIDPSIIAEYGVLYTINVDDNYQAYIKGISLGGNQTGTTEFNSKELATDGVRCLFQLNEWISITLDDEAPDGLQVYVFKFINDPNLYNDVKFDDTIEGYVAMCSLTKPEEEGNVWGEFYVNPDDSNPGDYNLVFVYQGKAVSQIRVALVAENSVQDLSDSEIEALTK